MPFLRDYVRRNPLSEEERRILTAALKEEIEGKTISLGELEKRLK